MKKNRVPILMVWLLLIAPSGFAQSTPALDRNLIITDGTAEILAQNDSASISIAVITEGKNLDAVSSENAAKTKAVLDAVKGLGIENLKIKTAGYRVTPQKDYKARPPVIKGYEVFNAIEATLEGWAPEQLSRHVTKTIGKALDSGANSIQSVQFYIKNRESLENEALKKAVQQAIERGKIMAAAAGVKLKRIVSLSTQPIEIRPQPRMLRAMDAMEMKADAAEAAPPMEIGESRVSAQVGIIYEIEP